MPDIPLLILALTVTVYWGRVGNMVRRARRRSNDLKGLVPEQPGERRVWMLLVPLIGAWIALPWLGLARRSGTLALPAFAVEPPYSLLRWLAAAAAVASLYLTIQCWKRMGKDWRMDMSAKNKAALITDGLYERVRHPIYALQILLMVCTTVVLPTVPMLAVAAAHIAVMVTKARNEERHLLSLHGQAYADYVARTGRFIPRPPSGGARAQR
jgi:protein-S-isoprenylcysteine O-methyltransferase Ste14